MNRRIEITDDVYDALATHVQGFEQPNDVLRRILNLDATAPSAAPTTQHRGRLAPLLEAGRLMAGDTLQHIRPRRGDSFTATVDEHGFVVTEHGRYEAPSPALSKLVGSQIDGWKNWKHAKSGHTLSELRDMQTALRS